MSTQVPNGSIPLPEINIFKSDKPFSQRLKGLRDEFQEFFEHLKFTILIPLSWFLTTFKFIRVLIWRFLTLPLRLFINFYERRVRVAIPFLPSIWGTLFILFPRGVRLPTVTTLTAGPYKGAGPIGNNPTINVDDLLNEIQSNGPSGSKLETALKKIPTFSPGDLVAGLDQVKAAQAEAEKSLKLTGP